MKYKTVVQNYNETDTDFDRRVENYLKKGWKLKGGVGIALPGTSSCLIRAQALYYHCEDKS